MGTNVLALLTSIDMKGNLVVNKNLGGSWFGPMMNCAYLVSKLM